MQAIGLNFIDTYHRSGLYPVSYPAILGVEAAGMVEAVGDGRRPASAPATASPMRPPRPAPMPSSRVLPAAASSACPTDSPFDLAAGRPAQGHDRRSSCCTATFHVKQGDAVLIHAAAGGVGSILVQWAKALGAMVIGTAGSQAKLDLARELGCRSRPPLPSSRTWPSRCGRSPAARACRSSTIRSARPPSRPRSPASPGAA